MFNNINDAQQQKQPLARAMFLIALDEKEERQKMYKFYTLELSSFFSMVFLLPYRAIYHDLFNFTLCLTHFRVKNFHAFL